MERTRFLVIGAGVTGLSFANFVDDDDYVIVEANDEIGGYCRTVRRDGFVWDYSGHFFHFKRPEIEKFLVDRMDPDEVSTIVKSSKIRYADRLIDFPFQKNIHQLPQDDFVDALHDLYVASQADHNSPPASFAEMVYRRFGKSIAEQFLIPYNEKLYACELTALDADAMGRFFPHADLDGIIRNFRAPDNASYNATFTYPRGGAIQYVRALAHDLDDTRIRLETRVTAIDLNERVAQTTAGPIAFEHLISSAPFPALLAMAGIEHDATALTWNKVLVFNLGFDSKGPEGVHWIYFPERKYSFYRIGFYDNIFGTDRMSMYVELGYPKDATFDADAARDRVIEDLRTAGVVRDHTLVASHSVVLDPAYVHINKRSRALYEEIAQSLATRGAYSIGRYGSWTYCSIEDNIVEARDLADAFNRLG